MTIAYLGILFTSLSFAGSASAQDSTVSTTHDGTWSIHLVCPAVGDKSLPVKGYDFTFPATVSSGRLHAQYATAGALSSLTYVGQVLKDGTVEIRANGVTGAPEYSVGRVGEGTKYSYTMRGTLAAGKGEARREEGRPCTASFTKK